MNTVTVSHPRLGLTVLGLAAALGLLGDQLLRAMPWGLNLTLVSLALIAAGTWLVLRYRLPASKDAPWLATTAVLCAVAFVRRDSAALQTIDVFTLLGILGLCLLAAQGAAIRHRGITVYLVAICTAAAHTWFGAPRLVFGDMRWGEVPVRGRWREAGAVAAGLLIALPLLAVFGGLFVSADATFDSLVSSVHIDVPLLMSHVALTGVCAAFAAGALRGAWLGNPAVAAIGERMASPALRYTTGITVLAALDALFLLFVAVQARWLFGGADLVQATTGLTVAEYARRGFFELVTAAALVVPVLLVAEWATLREGPKQETSFRALATVLVLLVGVLLVSALQRMLLYVQAFGLTEQRLYTTAFMVWVALVCGWLAWTVLRGARPRFAFGALVQGLAGPGRTPCSQPGRAHHARKCGTRVGRRSCLRCRICRRQAQRGRGAHPPRRAAAALPPKSARSSRTGCCRVGALPRPETGARGIGPTTRRGRWCAHRPPRSPQSSDPSS